VIASYLLVISIYLLLITIYLLLIAIYLLVIAIYLLVIAIYLLVIAIHLLVIAIYLLVIASYLLVIASYPQLGRKSHLGSGTGVLVSEDLSALTGGGELPAGERSINCGEENSSILAATPLVGEGVWPRRTPKAGDMSPIVFVAPPRFLIRFTLGLKSEETNRII
jgi:hypothetical protein